MPQVFEDIIVDAEFAALIPPLSAEERQQLEENIIEHGGARDPLVVWASKGKLTVLDGHNRYEICTRLELPFDIHEMRFESREQAADWMDNNQLGRRNLSPDSFTHILGRTYKRRKRKEGRPKKLGQNDPVCSTAESLAKRHGVSPATVKRAEKFYDEVEKTPELKKAVEEGRPVLQVKRELKEAAREARREENRQKIAAVPEPEKASAVAEAKYATIVIDPPWDWGDEGDQDQLGRARPDYSTLSIDQLERLDVGGLADDDCHIYLWITNRSLPKGFRLLEAWGFRYITALTWVKPHFGMGNYFRGQTEHVLFGVKGSQPLKRKNAGTVFNAERGPSGHSSKPPAFLELVESCSPGPFLEMFSRSSRPGWVAWGENTNAAE
jgi:N6-adenosine-specific RNA methylase IME4/DNA-binding transcriptional regulator YhcF (GntR family)